MKKSKKLFQLEKINRPLFYALFFFIVFGEGLLLGDGVLKAFRISSMMTLLLFVIVQIVVRMK